MKAINSETIIKVPSGVTVKCQARQVTVSGPLGSITKSFKHLNVEIIPISTSSVKIIVWFGVRKHLACVRTLTTHITNMIKGVTKGYCFKMKAVFTHFPINMSVSKDGQVIEIRNYLGDKAARSISMLAGVKVAMSKEKDEILVTGTDLEAVSQSAASIQQSCAAKRLDIRKFLDGVYVSHRGHMNE